MSIRSEIDRIKNNISAAYTTAAEMGGTMPAVRDSAHLAETLRSVPAALPPGVPPDPEEVYNRTRPADWLPMPQPQDNEIYLLFHIPDGVSSLLAFTVSCTGNYTVETGTVVDGQFSPQSTASAASGSKYETELFADDFGSLTSTGMKQCMVRISGTDILTWEPSKHSRKTLPANFSGWNIVEIACRLPSGTKVMCGNSSVNLALKGLRYFAWYGSNHVLSMSSMFYNCYSLITVLHLDAANTTTMSGMFYCCYSLTAVPLLHTGKVTNMSNMFYFCYSLTAVPMQDTANVTNMSSMFRSCFSLAAVPQMNTEKVTNMSNMFYSCCSLAAIPALDTGKVTNMGSMFYSCSALTTIPRLDTGSVTSISNVFYSCYALAKLTLNPLLEGWNGYDINLSGASLAHQGLVDLFNSLPSIASAKTLTITGNPGVSELTDAEKQIAADKNWTLKL